MGPGGREEERSWRKNRSGEKFRTNGVQLEWRRAPHGRSQSTGEINTLVGFDMMVSVVMQGGMEGGGYSGRDLNKTRPRRCAELSKRQPANLPTEKRSTLAHKCLSISSRGGLRLKGAPWRLCRINVHWPGERQKPFPGGGGRPSWKAWLFRGSGGIGRIQNRDKEKLGS